jgi:RNA-splicing ligase RtcB
MAVSITTQPLSQKCLEGGAANFIVVAASTNPPLTYQWYKNSILIGGQTNATLILTNVQKINEAKYTVAITDNDGNPITSSQASLTVSCEKGLVPLLIADSGNPGGQIVTASVEVVGGGEAYHAFDGGIAVTAGSGQDGWSTTTNTPSGFLQIYFPTSQLVRKYRIFPPSSTNSSPLTWTLQASLDGSSWVIIDTRTNVTGWAIGHSKDFSTSAIISYNFFKLIVTSNQTGSGTLGISEWLLFNDALLNVAVSFPSSGARETIGGSVDIQVVTTNSPSRTVQNVKFYANTTLIGNNATTPFDFNWTNAVAGTFTLTAVMVNDLGEQAVSQTVLTVWTTTPASLPPIVVLSDPINGAHFPITPAIIDISYVVSSPGNTITEIEILVDGGVVDDTIGSLGNLIATTFHWRGTSAGVGSHTLAVRATDSNAVQTTSSIITFHFDASTGSVRYGTPAIITNTDLSLVDLVGAAAFVWRFWDLSSKVTNKGAVDKPINRTIASFTTLVFDAFGRYEVLASDGSTVTVDIPPKLTKIVLPESQTVIPYYVTIVISAKDENSTPVFAWKDAVGNLLAVSDPAIDGGTNFTYTHKVTNIDEKIFLTVGETADWGNQLILDFTLPGKINTPPVVSPLAVGLKPKAWTTVLDSVLCTTTSPIHQLAGQPILDNVQIPPVWQVGTPNKRLGPSRVLVRNQIDRSTNGIYLTTTSQLTYNAIIGNSGIITNTVQYDGASLFISNTDKNGIDVSTILTEHLTIGNLIVISETSTDNMMQFQITSIALVTGGFTVGVIPTDSTGTVSSGPNILIDFGWTKTDDVLTAGVTVQVTSGTLNAGDYYAAVTDFDSEATNSNPAVQFTKVNIDYSGSGAAKSLMYVESASEDLVELDCTAIIDFLTTTSNQNFVGSNQTLLRAKIVTAGIATGDYVATETVVDTSPVTGFTPASTTIKATVSITNPA